MPLLPLGGEGTDTGGHKGYALSLMVELLCSIFTGQRNPATGHFMGAIDIKSFREPALVYQHMAETFDKIKNLKKAPNREHIYIPGELEAKAEEENNRLGIFVSPAVLKQVRRLNTEMNLGFRAIGEITCHTMRPGVFNRRTQIELQNDLLNINRVVFQPPSFA